MRSSPSVRVAVVNWNGLGYLEKCVKSLTRQTYGNYEITVVDNASTDGSAQAIRQQFPEAKVIQLDHNYGFASAANTALRKCGKDYGIVMNNDAWVEESFIEVLVNVAESDPRIASVGCKVVKPTDGSIDHSYVPMFIDSRRFIYKGPYLLVDPDDRQYEHQCRVLSNCACAVLYRISALEKIGFYDENLFSNFEDHDAGYRFNLAGYYSVYTPDTVVFHAGGASEGPHSSPKRVKLIVRNVLYTYLKDYEGKELLTVTPLVVVALAGVSLLYWNEDRSRLTPLPWAFAFLAGLKELLPMMPRLMESRKRVQQTRVVPDRVIFRQNDIKQFSFYRKKA